MTRSGLRSCPSGSSNMGVRKVTEYQAKRFAKAWRKEGVK